MISPPDKWLSLILLSGRRNLALAAGLLITVIAVTDWFFEDNVSFGFLYLFPMLMLGACCSRPQIIAAALLCTGLTEAFDPFPWNMPDGISRLILNFVALFGTGLYGFVSAGRRHKMTEQVNQMKLSAEARYIIEEQTRSVIANSPASIFTIDASGRFAVANQATHDLLGLAPGLLTGELVERFFPALASVPTAKEAPFFHTEMECQAKRGDNSAFLAHIFFSTYQTLSGPTLAAVVFDASEDLRDRTEEGFDHMLRSSRLLVGALAHEIRNLCAAISVLVAKLRRETGLGAQEDFQTLGVLVRGLERLSGQELPPSRTQDLDAVDLCSVLDELKIILEPTFADSAIVLTYDFPTSLPRVLADHQLLLQIFLNIARNAHHAMLDRERRELKVSVDQTMPGLLTASFLDSGSGIVHPDRLFEPFQPGANNSGLGLYISRSFVRSFSGDLEYVPVPQGACFRVVLKTDSRLDRSGRP